MTKYVKTALLFIVIFLSFTFSIRYFQTTDSLPNNLVAFNLIFNKRIDINNYKKTLIEKDLIGIAVESKEGVLFSKTPPILGILSAPVFIIANEYFGVDYLNEDTILNSEYGQYIGKIAASVYTSLAAFCLYLILKKINQKVPHSLVSLTVFVFGTATYNTASQANWQHGVSLFFILLFLYIFLSNPENKRYIFITGVIAGLLTQVRISNCFYLLFPILFWIFNRHNLKQILKYSTMYFIGVVGGYGGILYFYTTQAVPSGYSNEIMFSLANWNASSSTKNLISILFSYNNGLLLFSPVLVLSFLSLRRIYNNRKKFSLEEKIIISLIPILLLFLLFASSWWMWSGGKALNARLLVEAIPIFIFLLNYSMKNFWSYKIYRCLFAFTLLISIYLNFVTTFQMSYEWYDKYLISGHENQVRNAWFHKPTLIEHLVKKNYIYIDWLYPCSDSVCVRKLVLRPSIQYRKLAILFDQTSDVLVK